MRELTPGQLKQLMAGNKENAFCIVDVRQAAEYRLDHIPGAVNIPLAEAEKNHLSMLINCLELLYPE